MRGQVAIVVAGYHLQGHPDPDEGRKEVGKLGALTTVAEGDEVLQIAVEHQSLGSGCLDELDDAPGPLPGLGGHPDPASQELHLMAVVQVGQDQGAGGRLVEGRLARDRGGGEARAFC